MGWDVWRKVCIFKCAGFIFNVTLPIKAYFREGALKVMHACMRVERILLWQWHKFVEREGCFILV